jgi:hypothetical protein
MSDTKKTAGEQILEFLRDKGKKARKAGTATTEEIAAAIGKPIKYTYDRLFWMEKKDGVLQSSGVGKARVWRTAKKARPAKAQEATQESSAAAES